MPSERFTAWLSEDERSALSTCAAENEVSQNTVVRIAVRALLLDKPIPRWLEVTEVTQVTTTRTS